MRFTFLGTGTSVGVPQIGCECPVCTSKDPRDRRRRCGAYVQGTGAAFLIDTPPEMREACIGCGVRKVDAVCLTHAHMDHVAGFDDVRRFNTINGGAPMRCYADGETILRMHNIFPYIKAVNDTNGLFRPMINFVDNSEPFRIGGISIERLEVSHSFPCSGYLLTAESGKRLGYISDAHELPDETVEKLKGADVMVMNCLRERSHPTHLNFEAAQGYFRRIGAKKGFTIHMCHDFSHVQWQEKWRGTGLDVEPAYDGMEITL